MHKETICTEKTMPHFLCCPGNDVRWYWMSSRSWPFPLPAISESKPCPG